MFKKKKYIAVFLRKENDGYTIIKKRRFNPNINSIKYNKVPIPINTVNYSFTSGLNLYYYISITDKRQLFFEKSKERLIGTKIIDMIINDEIISQITSNLNKSNIGMNIISMIFSGLFGGLVGFIVGGYIPIG